MATAFGCAVECLGCDQKGAVTTAKALNKEGVKKYIDELKTYRWNLPPIEDTVKYAVYKLSSTKKFRHHSLLFVCKSRKYKTTDNFTFELDIVPKGGEYSIVPTTKINPSINLDKHEKLGTIFMSAKEIIVRGLQCLTEFGDYDKYTNNCQNFCKKLAKGFGLSSYPWTDAENAAIIAAVVVGAFGIVALGAAIVVALKHRASKKE